MVTWLPQVLDLEVHQVDIQRIPMVGHNLHSIWPWLEKSQMTWFWTNAAQEDSFPRLKMIPKKLLHKILWFLVEFERYPAEVSTLNFGIIPGQSGILYLSHGCVFTSSSASDITFQSKIIVFSFFIYIIKHVQTHVKAFLLGRKSYLLGGLDFWIFLLWFFIYDIIIASWWRHLVK